MIVVSIAVRIVSSIGPAPAPDLRSSWNCMGELREAWQGWGVSEGQYRTQRAGQFRSGYCHNFRAQQFQPAWVVLAGLAALDLSRLYIHAAGFVDL